MKAANSPAMPENDSAQLEALANLEKTLRSQLCLVAKLRAEIFHKNGVRHGERIAPRVLQMRARASQ